MNREDIIRLAREAGLAASPDEHYQYWTADSIEELERFAALVAAHEREENVDIIEKMAQLYYEPLAQTLTQIADAIRNRT